MDKPEYFKNIWKKGGLHTGYSALKILGLPTALVFERINTEYNHAVGKGLLISNSYFAYDEAEIAQSIGLLIEDVQKSIEKLERLYLIKTKEINTFKLMYIDIEYVCEYIHNKEKENNYREWDYGLRSIQYHAFSSFSFDFENKKLLEESEYDDGDELMTDENGNYIGF